jgi:hypothetical protein
MRLRLSDFNGSLFAFWRYACKGIGCRVILDMVARHFQAPAPFWLVSGPHSVPSCQPQPMEYHGILSHCLADEDEILISTVNPFAR